MMRDEVPKNLHNTKNKKGNLNIYIGIWHFECFNVRETWINEVVLLLPPDLFYIPSLVEILLFS